MNQFNKDNILLWIKGSMKSGEVASIPVRNPDLTFCTAGKTKSLDDIYTVSYWYPENVIKCEGLRNKFNLTVKASQEQYTQFCQTLLSKPLTKSADFPEVLPVNPEVAEQKAKRLNDAASEFASALQEALNDPNLGNGFVNQILQGYNKVLLGWIPALKDLFQGRTSSLRKKADLSPEEIAGQANTFLEYYFKPENKDRPIKEVFQEWSNSKGFSETDEHYIAEEIKKVRGLDVTSNPEGEGALKELRGDKNICPKCHQPELYKEWTNVTTWYAALLPNGEADEENAEISLEESDGRPDRIFCGNCDYGKTASLKRKVDGTLNVGRCECEGECHPEGPCSNSAIPENKTIEGTKLCDICWQQLPSEFKYPKEDYLHGATQYNTSREAMRDILINEAVTRFQTEPEILAWVNSELDRMYGPKPLKSQELI